MTVPELLAPAGDFEKLQTAYDYGADAAYIGGELFGLRAKAGNFSGDNLVRARELAQQRDKKLFLTLNAYLNTAECDALAEEVERLKPLDFDAYIIADPGVLALVRRIDPERCIHLSTQANTTNFEAVRFWQQAGVSRINLAREMGLEEMRRIRKDVDLELEVFIHGAMCVAYSGRCLLSSAMTGRSANSGACSHPCRWKYALVEQERPGEYYPIAEDETGSYILNSRDLCLLDHLPGLIEAGIDSLKIEGRMKSRFYLAAVTRVYRAAIDRYLENPQTYSCDPVWREELNKISHRPYDTGFLLGNDDARIHEDDSIYIRTHDFIGLVLEVDADGMALVEGRNRFFPGEMIELIGPQMRTQPFVVGSPVNADGETLKVIQPNALVRMPLPEHARPGDLLRRETETKKEL
jgi:putative protease